MFDTLVFSHELVRVCASMDGKCADTIYRYRGEPTNSEVSYIGISTDDPRLLSYMTEEREARHCDTQECSCDDCLMDSPLRYKGKPAKVLRRTGLFSEDELTHFATAFSARAAAQRGESLTVTIVRGEDIRYWYHEDTYLNQFGTIGSSCMRYPECQSYFGIYTCNPDRIGMVIATSDGRLAARALVWLDDTSQQWIDRIYFVNQEAEEKIKTWAVDNGYQSCYKVDTPITVTLSTPTYYNHYPYMDSMAYFQVKALPTGTVAQLTNTIQNPGTYRELRSTDGSCSTDTYELCPHCGQMETRIHADVGSHAGPTRACGDCITLVLQHGSWLQDETERVRVHGYCAPVVATEVVDVDGERLWMFDPDLYRTTEPMRG